MLRKLRPNMAALEEGFQYGLSSKSISSSSKTVVHVKLTDTSLKLIEDYIKKKSSGGVKPTIQFDGSHGVIQLPANKEQLRPFQFSLSAIQGDHNGSFDAVCQKDTIHGDQLSLQGSMTNKIQIRATNELFKDTKERVTKAELDSKKVSTKVIKQSGPHISKKKVIRQTPSIPQHRHNPVPPTKPKPQSGPPINFSKRPSPVYGSQGQAVSPYNPSSVGASARPPSPSLSSHTSHSSSSKPPPGNQAVMSMPYRDRIIHLLAIRPYKKPELIIRLRRDGIRDKDRDSLGTILQSVSVSKDNSFSLARHMYSEVRLDWPFYSDEDREILKKKIQSACSLSPSASPANRSPDSQSNPPVHLSDYPKNSEVNRKSESQKRPVEENPSTTHYNVKKKRISLYESKPSSRSVEYQFSSERRSSSNSGSSNNVSSTTDMSDKKENISDAVDSTSDTPEYHRQYFSIANDDQRYKYKQEFNTEYAEYKELHANIEKVSKKFYELQVLRKKTPRNTSQYEDLEERIRNEYVTQKSDPKYMEQKKRFEFLHGKLAFIKKLIQDYDQSRLMAVS